MMMKGKILILIVLLTCSVGCQDDDLETMTEFEKQIVKHTGTDAINCGTVGIGESALRVNTCATDSYTLILPFYAIYLQQGFDGAAATAVSLNEQGQLKLWSYDGSQYTDMPIASVICHAPTIKLGAAIEASNYPFTCNNN